MKRFRFLNALLLAAALFAAGCSVSVETRDADDGGGGGAAMQNSGDIRVSEFDVNDITYPEVSSFRMPSIEEMELENGMKVYLIEDHELPTVSASARLGAGSVYEPADEAGLASLTGTVMRTGGTASRSSDEINQTLEALGATVETSVGQTSGSAYMNTLADNVDEVLPIFVDVLEHPAFAEDKVEQAKTRQKTAISRRNDNPQQIASREFSKLIYGPDSPYARVPQYYTIDNIERQDLMDFHAKYFHPNNVQLSVWGDFDSARMKQKLRRAFGDWERAPGFEKPEPPTVDAERSYSVNFIQKDDVTQSTIFIGHPGELKRSDPDYFPVIVMNKVLSGGFSGRLFQNVRKDQGLAYAVFGNYGAGYNRDGQFFSGVLTKSGTTVEATRAVIDQIEKMRRQPPTEDELQLAKDAYLNSFVFNFDTRSEILGRLMTYDYYDYPRDFLEQIKNGVEQVSAQDVLRVSKKYLHPDQADILVVGRQQDFGQPLSALTKGGGAVNEIDITIPTSAPGEGGMEEETASEEEMAAGRAVLADVREAMGGPGAFDRIESMRQSTTTVAQTPQGEQTIESTLGVELPGKLHTEITLPNGLTLTVADDGEQMMLQTPGGTQPAPPPFKKQVNGQLSRTLVYLMTRADDLDVSSRGMETVDGSAYQALRITPPGGGNAFTLYVDPDTMLPARMEYQGMNPQSGPFDGANVYADYREVDGVMVPYETTSYQDGEKAGVATVTNFETNVDFEDGYFSLGQ